MSLVFPTITEVRLEKKRRARRPIDWRAAGKRLARWAALFTAIVLLWGSRELPGRIQAILWLAALVGGGLWLHRGQARIFGPVMFWDMIRTARQGRNFFVRACYVLALFAVLRLAFARDTVSSRDAAELAERFFLNFTWVQFVVMFFLTPMYVAGAITEEKERGTLEYLLASDLESREILLGKLVSRLSHLLVILLAGLPVLAFTQFLGGVSPELVLASFYGTGLFMLNLACLSLLMSVRSRRIIDAVFATYFWAGLYLSLSSLVARMLPLAWALATSLILLVCPPLEGGLAEVGFLVDFFQTYSLGNPILVVTHLAEAWSTSINPWATLIFIFQDYTFASGILCFLLCRKAIRDLRGIALEPEAPKPLWKRTGVDWPPLRHRRKLGQWPLFWKEVHGEPPMGSARFSAFFAYFHLVLGWVLAAGVLSRLAFTGLEWGWGDETLGQLMNPTIRNIGNLLQWAMLLAVAFYASGAMSRERERQTLESLLVLPVESDAILFAKWVGAVLSVSPVWWCLGAIWGVGLVTGGLHPLALPLLMISWLTFAAFTGMLGLFFSVYTGSSLKATLATFTTLAILTIGTHALTGPVGYNLDRGLVDWIEMGLAPFCALDVLAFNLGQPARHYPPSTPRNIQLALLGVLCYGAAAGLLWMATRHRFRELANRAPVAGKPRS